MGASQYTSSNTELFLDSEVNVAQLFN